MLSAVLDACVLYPAPIRDVLLSVAAEGCYLPFWSHSIHNEWQRNLLENRKDLNQEQLNNTASIMDRSFRSANVNDFHHLVDSLTLPDAKDSHVLALAIRVEAQFIVTNNLKDFPKENLDQYNIKSITADDFLSEIFKQSEELVLEGLRRQRKRLKSPPKSQAELIEALDNSGLTEFSKLLREKVESI